ncbi:Rha family transcriptional regulator [Acinetobacter pittii]|uniref:Rha family transcriptional regulator n=1 Tax=Acinetobacter pittii TaxID=48296 RepID=UPI00301E3750
MHLLKQLNHEQLTMSSREVAELTGKEHFNVKRDCEVMFRELNLDALKFEGIYFDKLNRKQTEYLLTKELVETLITGYSIKLRHLVILRLNFLEDQLLKNSIVLPNFNNPAEAARAWANEVESKQLALKQLEIAAPKVDFYDVLAERQNLMNATQLAQKFKKSAVAFNKILESFDVYNRCVKRGRVFQQWFIDQGLGELKETALGFAQPMFTTKGEQWVFNKFASEGII